MKKHLNLHKTLTKRFYYFWICTKSGKKVSSDFGELAPCCGSNQQFHVLSVLPQTSDQYWSTCLFQRALKALRIHDFYQLFVSTGLLLVRQLSNLSIFNDKHTPLGFVFHLRLAHVDRYPFRFSFPSF